MMVEARQSPHKGVINNGGSNPNNDMRRSGGSVNDPHGGHEHVEGEWKGPNPDPISELVPGGQGAEPTPYPKDAVGIETLRAANGQPGFGPREIDKPTLAAGFSEDDDVVEEGDIDPLSAEGRIREGMSEGESGKR